MVVMARIGWMGFKEKTIPLDCQERHNRLTLKNKQILLFALFTLLAFASGRLHGAYRETVGWNKLVAELGEEVPLGRGIAVSLIESPPFNGNYQPDTNNFEFPGKSFTMRSGDSGISSHATIVAQLFFGNSSSMARAIDTIDVYESVDWLFTGFLRVAEEEPPAIETRRVQNHSWTGAFTDGQVWNVEAIRRFDYAIERDGFVAVVALSNNTGAVPALLAHSYNAITVGRPDGNHSRGGTWFDKAGRVRPDLVTPGALFTNFAPIISSAAAVLLEEADRNPGLANARHHPQVIKSVLMAGASKVPFSNWSRTPEQPLDEVFGAGQLDIYNSYRILTGGEHDPTEEPFAPDAGWHLGNTASGSGQAFLFSFDREQETFTVNLTWNRRVIPEGGADFLAADILLAHLELRLFEMDGTEPGDEIQTSTDPLNNNQHLYTTELPAGDYALIVNRIDGLTDDFAYALAWNAVAAPIGPPKTFAAWRNLFFSDDELNDPDISGPGADPDGDTIPNLMEYALGADPRQAGRNILPVEGIVTEESLHYVALTMTRPIGLEDIAYRVDTSSDLKTWAEGAGVLINSAENEDGTVTETYRDPDPLDAATRRFLRLTITP